jgi:hypothetical protein
MTLEEAQQLIQKSKAPKGVVTQAPDGRYFFLSDEDAKRTAISPGKLYSAYRHVSQGPTAGAPQPELVLHGCKEIKTWLDASSPDSAEWREICNVYFDLCV